MATIYTNDGVALHVEAFGTGAPIVFVHGNNFDSTCWEYFTASLPEHGFHCIAYDRRGFGRSERSNAPYTYDRLADDLAAVLTELNLSNVTLVGHSLGCGEIVRYMSRHGSARIAGTVLIGTATPSLLKTADNPNGLAAEALAAVADQTLNDRPAYFSSVVDDFLRPGVSAQMKAYLLDVTFRTSLAAAVDCAKLSLRPGSDFTQELLVMNKPMLIIHGDEDHFFPLPLTAMRTAALVKHSVLKVYENAGHGLMFSMAQRLRDDIAAFAREGVYDNNRFQRSQESAL